MSYGIRAASIKRLAKFWLFVAMLLAVLWCILWLGAGKSEHQVSYVKEEPKTIKDLTLPKTISNLYDFNGEVPLLSLDEAKQELSNHSPQFKDKSYLDSHKNKYTVKVMEVYSEQVILDYLDRQDDKEKFSYFRYTDAFNDKKKFMLIYGVFDSFSEASSIEGKVDFGRLDKTRKIVVTPEQMSRLADQVDDYMAIPEVIELAPPPKKVDLKETAKKEEQPSEEVEQDEAPVKNKTKTDKKAAQELDKKEVQTPELPVPPTAIPTPEAESQVADSPSEETESDNE